MQQPNRLRLATLPTPLVKLERLARELGGADLWIKRDDLTGLELSGNKVRKLEFIAAEALASGCDTLVTEGTCQSNHCRATAAVCAKLGLNAVLLFRPLPAEGTPQGNHLLDLLFGAETRSYSREEFAAGRERIVEGVLSDIRSRGGRPRWTPAGASEPLGCWGYIHATTELADQLVAAGIGDCDIVLGISSAGTCAGIVLGKLIQRLDQWSLWAIPVSDNVDYHTRAVAELCRAAIKHFDLPVQYDPDAVRFVDGYVGEGYGVPYDAALDAIRLLARTEAIVLDPVYTGKAFCGLLEQIKQRRLGYDRPVVFLHTGGVFSNFAWPDALL